MSVERSTADSFDGVADQKIRVFGTDWTILGNRSADDASEGCEYCLCCNEEKIQIEPTYAFEVVRLFVRSLECVESCLDRIVETVESKDYESIPPLVSDFETAVSNLNRACDATTPFAVWLVRPDKRVGQEPPALDAILAVEQFATYLYGEVLLPSAKHGPIWNCARGVITMCREQIDALTEAIHSDDRMVSVIAGWDENKFETLRLSRLQPVESWHFCSAECCSSYDSEELQQEHEPPPNSDPIPLAKSWLSKPRKFGGPTKDQQKFVETLIESGGYLSHADLSIKGKFYWETPRKGATNMVGRINGRIHEKECWRILPEDNSGCRIVLNSDLECRS